MKVEKVFLFDMDGTLTPARKKIEPPVVKALQKLTKIGKVGVVTGSDYDYVQEQMGFALKSLDRSRVEILPCNGTKKYALIGEEYALTSHVDMIDELGRSNFNDLLLVCSQWQNEIMRKFSILPFTGTFLQFRGSLLNWCPIGRSANDEQRSKWVDFDNKNIVRVKYVEMLKDYLHGTNTDVTVALGGSTSIDIYPTGWDKTYALKHYEGCDIFFVGDKCTPGGNDHQIYEALKGSNRSFETRNTSETCEIIEKFLEELT